MFGAALAAGVLHRYGYLKWVKEEWFTWRWLKPRCARLVGFRVTDEELAATAVRDQADPPAPASAGSVKQGKAE